MQYNNVITSRSTTLCILSFIRRHRCKYEIRNKTIIFIFKFIRFIYLFKKENIYTRSVVHTRVQRGRLLIRNKQQYCRYVFFFFCYLQFINRNSSYTEVIENDVADIDKRNGIFDVPQQTGGKERRLL